MKVCCLHIKALVENDQGWDVKTYDYQSPKKYVASGTRLRIGWFFLRVGTWILYGNRGENNLK